MENFNLKLAESKKKVVLADYMLTNTYSMLKEPKILVSVLENIFIAFKDSLSSLLSFERAFKRIPAYGTSFEAMANIYISKVQTKYSLDKEFIRKMHEIKEIIDFHLNSGVEFQRKENFIIANDMYDLKTLNKEKISIYLRIIKDFNKKIDKIIGEYND